MQEGKCVYIIKTSKRLYKIGKTRDLQKRMAGYVTHLPAVFRVVRQYMALNMDELEEALHVVFQHKRVKGEWFELNPDDLVVCDNIARNYALCKLQKQKKQHRKIEFSGNPLLQVMEANAKYLSDYARIVEDIKIGLSTDEIVELHQGQTSKTTVQTVRKILDYQTPNAEFLSHWVFVVNDMEAGLTVNQIIEKHQDKVSRSTIQTIRRILRNQLY
ncbi:MAG: GIY-YIG nuclease family protein [Cytophagales bacterium]|nr:GIY-YIG nuclease family protein [Cytophagales bacterium]